MNFGYSFPYKPESFTPEERKVLSLFFTNYDKPVFAIHNLPQEVVGAMFSRYSRTTKSIRRVFLDEFWSADELGIKKFSSFDNKAYEKAKERTRDFYRKVFAEYGDDSVIQMGSVHIAFEFVSQLIGAKAIEDQRVASAYIAKSTRYVDFRSKVNDHFLFVEPPEIMSSRFAKEFLTWNKLLFDAYSRYIPVVIEYLSKKYPLNAQKIEDTKNGKLISFNNLNDYDKVIVRSAHERALKAKALDLMRFFLPSTTAVNLGAHFSGQATETTINKMLSSPFSEVRFLGAMALKELVKIFPNFLQNIGNSFGKIARDYRKEVRNKMLETSGRWERKISNIGNKNSVRIINWDKDADVKIASQILFTGSYRNLSKEQIYKWAQGVKKKEGKVWSPTLVKIIYQSLPDRKSKGRNRRQKLPRAFEHAYIEIEFYTDMGTYNDLQRNRLSSTEKQAIAADDVYIPSEYMDMENLLDEYKRLAENTRKLHNKMFKTKFLRDAAEYISIMGNKIRFNVKANLRQWVFFAELRTIAGGHPTYRYALQEATRQIIAKMPFTKELFAHVDWTSDYGLGRLKAEIRTQEELAKLKEKK